MPNFNKNELPSIFLFFLAGTGLSFFIFRRQFLRTERKRQRLLIDYLSEQEQLNATAHELLSFLVEIVNASARSGESEYLLAKRLNLILTSGKGEGRTLRKMFMRLADFCCSGFITAIGVDCPELTQCERSICAMMVIGLDPATICKICRYENEQTFYNKRKEIRRKFKLERPVLLEAFFKERIACLERERAMKIGILLP